MSETPKDLEETVRVALQAAEAANDAATDIGQIRAEYQDAADRLTNMRQNFSRLAIGLIVGSLFAVVMGGLVFFRTLGEMRTSNATQVEALKVFAETVKDLKSSIDDVQDVSITLSEIAQQQVASISTIDSKMLEIETAIGAKIANLGSQTQSLEPQIKTIIQAEFSDSLDMMRNDMLESVSDLQLALSKMIAASFEQTVKMQEAQVVARPAPAAVSKKTARATAKRSVKKPARKSRPKKAAPKPPANPFKFP